MTQRQLQDNYTFGPKIMTRYGRIVFSEETIKCLGLTENTYVKLGVDEANNKCFISISSNECEGAIKLKSSGRYYYISCPNFLKIMGLYSIDPTIYELVKEDKTNGESFYSLDKIITIKSPKIGMIFQNKEELRMVVSMLNAKI